GSTSTILEHNRGGVLRSSRGRGKVENNAHPHSSQLLTSFLPSSLSFSSPTPPSRPVFPALSDIRTPGRTMATEVSSKISSSLNYIPDASFRVVFIPKRGDGRKGRPIFLPIQKKTTKHGASSNSSINPTKNREVDMQYAVGCLRSAINHSDGSGAAVPSRRYALDALRKLKQDTRAQSSSSFPEYYGFSADVAAAFDSLSQAVIKRRVKLLFASLNRFFESNHCGLVQMGRCWNQEGECKSVRKSVVLPCSPVDGIDIPSHGVPDPGQVGKRRHIEAHSFSPHLCDPKPLKRSKTLAKPKKSTKDKFIPFPSPSKYKLLTSSKKDEDLQHSSFSSQNDIDLMIHSTPVAFLGSQLIAVPRGIRSISTQTRGYSPHSSFQNFKSISEVRDFVLRMVCSPVVRMPVPIRCSIFPSIQPNPPSQSSEHSSSQPSKNRSSEDDSRPQIITTSSAFMVRGVPQGASISSLLCTHTLSSVDRFVCESENNDFESNQLALPSDQSPFPLKSGIQCGSGVLIRYVDDYLYMTTQNEKVRIVYDKIRKYLAQEGLQSNDSKTQFSDQSCHTSRDVQHDSAHSSSASFITWCKIRILLPALIIAHDPTVLLSEDRAMFDEFFSGGIGISSHSILPAVGRKFVSKDILHQERRKRHASIIRDEILGKIGMGLLDDIGTMQHQHPTTGAITDHRMQSKGSNSSVGSSEEMTKVNVLRSISSQFTRIPLSSSFQHVIRTPAQELENNIEKQLNRRINTLCLCQSDRLATILSCLSNMSLSCTSVFVCTICHCSSLPFINFSFLRKLMLFVIGRMAEKICKTTRLRFTHDSFKWEEWANNLSEIGGKLPPFPPCCQTNKSTSSRDGNSLHLSLSHTYYSCVYCLVPAIARCEKDERKTFKVD
ncbi:Telomerase reverse transcriptase like protein, partial [Aduncisulcus paluster]